MNTYPKNYPSSISNLNELYVQLVEDIYNNGTRFEKKNGTVLREIIPATIEISNPKKVILTQPYRRYNPAFMIAECLWNLSGDTDEWLADYNNRYRKYFVDGHLNAGYGNRLINGSTNQLVEVINLLKQDPDTSRATLSIFNPNDDYKETNFVPCISFLKFRLLKDSNSQKNRLHMWSFMRAQDIWKGFPYDIYLLLTIFQYVANMLDVEMGSYYHICDTIRLYEEDMNDIKVFLDRDKSSDLPGEIILSDGFNITSNCDILKYRDLIKHNVFDIHLIDEIPEFWRNAILTCWVYKQIKLNNFNEAFEFFNEITNEFSDLILNWSEKFNRKFYDYITQIKGIFYEE